MMSEVSLRPEPDALERHLELLRQGIVAARDGDKAQARSLIRDALELRDDQEITWLWLASVAENRAEVQACMERILRLNPDNPRARDWLRKAAVLSAKPTAGSRFVALDTKPIPRAAARPVVLVVDDSPTLRMAVAEILESRQYRVVQAADGMQALTRLREITPALVLLDITMPHLDGYQICKVIKAHEELRNVPVIMLSGKDGFFDKVRGRMAGAVDYITKPVEPETLSRTVARHLRKEGGGRDI